MVNKSFIKILFLSVLLFALVGAIYSQQRQKINSLVSQQLPVATPIPTISHSDPAAVGEESVSTWQTYKNDQYGFSFQYPSSFISDVNNAHDALLILTKENNNQTTVGLQFMVINDDYQSYLAKFNTNLEPNTYQNTKYAIGNLNGRRLTAVYSLFKHGLDPDPNNPTETLLEYYFPLKNKKAFLVKTALLKSTNISDAEIQQILSTFKFTDSNSTTDTSSWKTYTNSTLGISLKYPDSIFVYQGNFQNNSIYWSNKSNGGTPMELGKDGLWMSLSATKLDNSGMIFYKNKVSTGKWTISHDLPIANAEVSYSYTAMQLQADTLYKIFIAAFTDSNLTKYKASFDQILSTFHFIN